ncbi:MAG: 3',5'-cyclic-nucleotide phosphodiesterase [Desulfovibrionales bacterium]
MKFEVLGCSGSDLPGFNPTSFRVDDVILLDAGTVTSVLTLEEQARITDIFVTHPHLDHIKDILFLADNLIELVAHNHHKPVRIRGLKDVLQAIKNHLLNDTIWPDFTVLPAYETPVLMYSPISDKEPVTLGDLRVATHPVNHGRCASGYVFWNETTGANFAYTGDTGPITSGWWDFLNALEIPIENLIIEASFPDSQEHLALLSHHLTPTLLKRELEKLDCVPNIFITHMKSPFATEITEQLHHALKGYSHHLLREGEVLHF